MAKSQQSVEVDAQSKRTGALTNVDRHVMMLEFNEHRKDAFIHLIREMMRHSFALGVMNSTLTGLFKQFEKMTDDCFRNPTKCRLKELVPSFGPMFTRLPLLAAFEHYNNKYRISHRIYVAPSFNEIRHILNLAQVLALGSGGLKMITFDGDETLYPHGHNFTNQILIQFFIELLKDGVVVAVVTAAAYGEDPTRFEQRFRGLLDAFVDRKLSSEVTDRFYLVAGECNFLFKYKNGRLHYKDNKHWRKDLKWEQKEVDALLHTAEMSIRRTVKRLHIRAKIIVKPTAVGVIPGGLASKKMYPIGSGHRVIRRELLDEVALAVSADIKAAGHKLPFCAFNGGCDVFVDIGDKSVAISALMCKLGLNPQNVIHVGDQFLKHGNDILCRKVCPTVWILGPEETKYILRAVLRQRGLLDRTLKVFSPEVAIAEADTPKTERRCRHTPSVIKY